MCTLTHATIKSLVPPGLSHSLFLLSLHNSSHLLSYTTTLVIFLYLLYTTTPTIHIYFPYTTTPVISIYFPFSTTLFISPTLTQFNTYHVTGPCCCTPVIVSYHPDTTISVIFLHSLYTSIQILSSHVLFTYTSNSPYTSPKLSPHSLVSTFMWYIVLCSLPFRRYFPFCYWSQHYLCYYPTHRPT